MIKCIDFLSNPKTKMRLRKGFNKYQCLTYIIEKYLNTGGHNTALLAYLCMAFNYIGHQLLIGKLTVYHADIYSPYFLAA